MDKILFFDGYCNLCNSVVDQLIRWDKKLVLKFAPLQGETARKMLPPERLTNSDPGTVLYLRNGQVYDRSTAILWSLNDMGGSWRMMLVFLLIPKFLRDIVYRFIAKIRYRVFGKRETCRVPTPQERERVLP